MESITVEQVQTALAWMVANKDQKFLHLWSCADGLEGMLWYAQYGNMQLQNKDLLVLLVDIQRYWETAQPKGNT